MKQIQNSKLETLHSLRSLRVANLCHPEPFLRHLEPSLRHPERSEGSQETRNTQINIGTGEDIGIKELADKIKTMYDLYLKEKK